MSDYAQSLIKKAYEAREYAYVPYSGFRVGAALLCTDGAVFTGCNIENAAYGPSNCAERTAVFQAVSKGYRTFRAIAVAGEEGRYVTPCGVCRQVLAEFCSGDFEVLIAKSVQEYKILRLSELLPYAFSKADLEQQFKGDLNGCDLEGEI